MINGATLIGRLTKDPELKTVGGGTELCEITIAFDKGFKDKKHPVFVEATAFGKTAVFINTYFKKGNGIVADVDIDMDSWTDTQTQKKRNKIIFKVEDVAFAPGNKDGGQAVSDQPKMEESNPDEPLPF